LLDSPFGVHLWSSHSRDWVAIIPASDILPWHAREFRLFVGLAAIFYFTAVSTESLVSNVSWQQEKEKEVSSFGVETLVLEIADVVLIVFVFCWLTLFYTCIAMGNFVLFCPSDGGEFSRKTG